MPFFAHLTDGVSTDLEHAGDALLRDAFCQCALDGGFFLGGEGAALGREGEGPLAGLTAASGRATSVGAELDDLVDVAAVRAG